MTKEQYNSLSVEKKAEICANLLDNGFSDYGDSCKLGEDGRYYFESADGELFLNYAPEELVKRFEQFYADSDRFEEELKHL